MRYSGTLISLSRACSDGSFSGRLRSLAQKPRSADARAELLNVRTRSRLTSLENDHVGERRTKEEEEEYYIPDEEQGEFDFNYYFSFLTPPGFTRKPKKKQRLRANIVKYHSLAQVLEQEVKERIFFLLASLFALCSSLSSLFPLLSSLSSIRSLLFSLLCVFLLFLTVSLLYLSRYYYYYSNMNHMHLMYLHI